MSDAGPSTNASRLIVATIYTLRAAAAPAFTETFHRVIEPRLVATGAPPVAVLETEPSRNNFPRLPVRENEHALVWFGSFAGTEEYDGHVHLLAADEDWTHRAAPMLQRALAAPVEVWRLTPTARSRVSW